MNVLEKICADKREYVEACEARMPLAETKARALDAASPRGFIKALKNHERPAIIAEVKKASPSKGIIREDFHAPGIARTYEENGAACLSVLTDAPYFQGADEYLVEIAEAVCLPLLRKDFMVSPYQIYESRALGTDCILLIMAALDDALAAELYGIATELDMDVLIEVHDSEELSRSLALKPEMIGVNSRNLKTLEVDLQTAFKLLPEMPVDMLKIAESGIDSHGTLMELQNAGFNGFLVGESLMRQHDIGQALRALRGIA